MIQKNDINRTPAYTNLEQDLENCEVKIPLKQSIKEVKVQSLLGSRPSWSTAFRILGLGGFCSVGFLIVNLCQCQKATAASIKTSSSYSIAIVTTSAPLSSTTDGTTKCLYNRRIRSIYADTQALMSRPQSDLFRRMSESSIVGTRHGKKPRSRRIAQKNNKIGYHSSTIVSSGDKVEKYNGWASSDDQDQPVTKSDCGPIGFINAKTAKAIEEVNKVAKTAVSEALVSSLSVVPDNTQAKITINGEVNAGSLKGHMEINLTKPSDMQEDFMQSQTTDFNASAMERKANASKLAAEKEDFEASAEERQANTSKIKAEEAKILQEIAFAKRAEARAQEAHERAEARAQEAHERAEARAQEAHEEELRGVRLRNSLLQKQLDKEETEG